MTNFTTLFNTHRDTLDTYVPVVSRVHGPSHPVFYDVEKQYQAITSKMDKDTSANIDAEFIALRKITDDYAIPSDTCETYEAVYNMLNELDKAYSQK